MSLNCSILGHIGAVAFYGSDIISCNKIDNMMHINGAWNKKRFSDGFPNQKKIVFISF